MPLPQRRVSDRAPHASTRAVAMRTRERVQLQPLAQSDHMRGWVLYGMSRALPLDASDEMRAGYIEARNNTISLLTAMEAP